MTLIKAIEREKRKLIKSARAKGLYENFGVKEGNALTDRYIDISVYTVEMNQNRRRIAQFEEWAMNYTGGKI